jgi:hypothetical protein
VGLLERQGGLEVILKVKPPIGFGPDSQVLRAQHVRYMQSTVERVLSPDREKVLALLKPMRLSESQINEMRIEFSAIVDRYAYLSEHAPHRDTTACEDWDRTLTICPAAFVEPAKIVNLRAIPS